MECHGQLYASANYRIGPHLTDKEYDSSKDNQLDFDAMDEFISAVLTSINEHGSRAVRVFPPAAQVIIYFAERLANEVVRMNVLVICASPDISVGRRIHNCSTSTLS